MSYHCKKRLVIFSSPAGMSLIKLSLAGNIKNFWAMESMVSGIPAGDGKSLTFFYSEMRHPSHHSDLGVSDSVVVKIDY
jgi:hypothetical protein